MPAATAVAPWKWMNAELKKHNSDQKFRFVKKSATGKNAASCAAPATWMDISQGHTMF